MIDLLKTDVFADYGSRPSLLRERYQNHKGLIVIDEVQKLPALLDEVHWLIENRGLSFLLTGSSARKLRRGHPNLSHYLSPDPLEDLRAYKELKSFHGLFLFSDYGTVIFVE